MIDNQTPNWEGFFLIWTSITCYSAGLCYNNWIISHFSPKLKIFFLCTLSHSFSVLRYTVRTYTRLVNRPSQGPGWSWWWWWWWLSWWCLSWWWWPWWLGWPGWGSWRTLEKYVMEYPLWVVPVWYKYKISSNTFLLDAHLHLADDEVVAGFRRRWM